MKKRGSFVVKTIKNGMLQAAMENLQEAMVRLEAFLKKVQEQN